MIDQTVSHYKVLEKLGEGGMGVVYKAEDTKLKRTVALKFLPADAVGQGEHRARFEREAQAAASLNHPNICTVYEIDENNGRPFIAMEFVGGETLAAIVEKGPLKIDDALDIAIQAARGLAEAHGRGIVHRDIKSANIMVAPERTGQERQVKLMDFGLAQLATARTQLTKEGSTLGTMAYMAPEQARGEKVDHRADIWALGVVLYEMVAGRQPYRADYEQAVLYSILNEAHEPLTAVRTGVPKELERIVDKALQKATAARYQNAEDLLVDLRELKRQRESGSQTRSVAPAAAGQPLKKWYAVGGAAAVAALAFILWTSRFGAPTAPPAEAPVRPVPFTSYDGIEFFATFSPDGSQAAFAWNGESKEQFDIYAKGVGTGQPLRLTNNPATDIAPSWSPDGRWIAFRRMSNEESSIYLVPPLGGSERKVAELSGRDWSLIGWSADARTLFVSDWRAESNSWVIFALDVESGEKRVFSASPSAIVGDFDPAVLQETGVVAYSRSTANNFAGIYTRPLAGGPENEVLAPASRSIRGLTWLDRDHLLFADLAGAIWRVSLNAPVSQTLTGLADGARGPVLSRSSKRLLYEVWKTDSNFWRYELRDGKSAASGLKVASSTQAEFSPRISPDGRRAVFVSSRSGQAEIWVADISGANSTQLTNLGQQLGSQGQAVGSPRWSPDGRRIAFDTSVRGSWDIYTVEVQGGSPKPLAVSEGEDSRPSWSSDGQWVYFSSNRSGQFEIWKAPAGGGDAVQVTRNGGYHPMESPDGRWLYYGKRPGFGIWRAPAVGGEESLVVAGANVSGSGFFDPADKGVYYLERDPETAGRSLLLKFHVVDTGQAHLVAKLPPPAPNSAPLDVAPDGTWYLYAQADEGESDLMLVENFQ